MATPTIDKRLSSVRKALTDAGLTGIDWASLIALFLQLLPMFLACLPLGQRHARALKEGRSYLGSALHVRRIKQAIEASGCCTGEGDNPAEVDDIFAVLLDEVANTSPEELVLCGKEATQS